MTMKYLDKNVSAETDEVVVTNVSLNNGVLTFTRKDFYSDTTNGLSILIDLKDIKLRIYKLKTGESLDDYKGDSISDEKKLRRETHLFLEPVNNNDNDHETEGVYHEYIWDEESKDFEMLGSTYLNLEPLEGRMDNIETAINTLREVVNDLESDIKSLQQNKVDKESGKSLIENSKITKLDGIQDGANKTVVDTEIKTSNNPVSNTAIKNALSNKVDKETGKGLMTDFERTKLNGIEIEANKTIVDTEIKTSNNPVSNTAIKNALSNKVDKETGKGLMTDAERTKLNGIETGATNTVIVDNLTTTDNNKALSANQGKTLKNEIDGKADASSLANYATKNDLNNYATKQELAEAEIDASKVDLTGYAKTSDLSTVATSGDYNDLDNKPDIPDSTADLINDSGFITASDVPESVDLTGYVQDSDLAMVATSGSYNDLDDLPDLSALSSNIDTLSVSQSTQNTTKSSGVYVPAYCGYTSKELQPGKFYLITNSLNGAPSSYGGNHVVYDSKGNSYAIKIIDNVSLSIYQSISINNGIPGPLFVYCTSSQLRLVNNLSAVEYTGDYNDLLNKPTLFDGDYNKLSNKPDLENKIDGYNMFDVNDLFTFYQEFINMSSYAQLKTKDSFWNCFKNDGNFENKSELEIIYYYLNNNFGLYNGMEIFCFCEFYQQDETPNYRYLFYCHDDADNIREMVFKEDYDYAQQQQVTALESRIQTLEQQLLNLENDLLG